MAATVPVPAPEAPTARRSRREWILDTGAFVLACGWTLVIMLLLMHYRPVPEALMLADIGAGWLACLAVWCRRRWPVALAVPLVLTGLFSTSTAMAALIALFTVAARRRLRVALGLGALYTATGVPFYLFNVNPLQMNNPYWWDLLWSTIVIALAVGWGKFAGARAALLQSLRERARRAEAEQHLRAEQARHLERERIAREMHDVLAHRISLVSMHAGALEFRTDASRDEVTRTAGVIRYAAHQALQDLREVIGVLRNGQGGGEGDTPERPQPTLADLPSLLDESRRAGSTVRWHNGIGEPHAVPASTARTAYRIVQEGLTNVRKHAAGAAALVTLAGVPGSGLTVEVRNPAPVGDPPHRPIPGTGTGLVGLAERAELAGGRLEHGTTDTGDFRLWAWLPWPA